MQPTTQMGPLISDTQLQRVLGFMADARDSADVVVGGERLGGDLADGYFVPATVVAGVRNDMRLAREEIFGPEIGRAHVCTPVNNAPLVCRLLLEKKKHQ